MQLHPITSFVTWLQGTAPLPAGAIPLASESGGVICLMPTGRWIMWLANCIHPRPPETQRAVMDVVIAQLGGTAAAAAGKLGVSPRTVEAWRSGKSPLPIKSAYALAQAIAASSADHR